MEFPASKRSFTNFLATEILSKKIISAEAKWPCYPTVPASIWRSCQAPESTPDQPPGQQSINWV